MLLKKLQNTDPKCSVQSGSCTFHYLMESGIVYLVVADRSYPKTLAFRFLEDIKALFQQHLHENFEQVKKTFES